MRRVQAMSQEHENEKQAETIAITGEHLILKEFHARVNEEMAKQKGYDAKYIAPISRTRLTELLAQGDISELLNVEGPANKRRFTPEAAEILGRFLPSFRKERGNLYVAPQMLRTYLNREPDLTIDHFLPNSLSAYLDKVLEALSTNLIPLREVLTECEVCKLLNAPMVEEVKWLSITIGKEHKRWRRKDILDYVYSLPIAGQIANDTKQAGEDDEVPDRPR